MLFLATAQLRDSGEIPRERMLGLIASTWATIDQLEQDGKVITGGAYVGRRGGFVVADVESHEDLSALLNRVPISGYLDWDVTPIVPAQSALQSARWAITQLQQREPASAAE